MAARGIRRRHECGVRDPLHITLPPSRGAGGRCVPLRRSYAEGRLHKLFGTPERSDDARFSPLCVLLARRESLTCVTAASTREVVLFSEGMRIWVDADACPQVIKDILFRAAERAQVVTTLVSNMALATLYACGD